MGYGYKYCQKFYETKDSFSKEGKDWVNCVRRKLTQFLVPKYKDNWGTCETIKKAAFDSHVKIYIECGFCNIWRDDMGALWKTFDLKDFFSADAVKQVISTLTICLASVQSPMVPSVPIKLPF